MLSLNKFSALQEDEPPTSPRQAITNDVDGPPKSQEEHKSDSSIQSTFGGFFKTTLGGLTLGLMAGSLTVFVGMKVYKAMAK